MQPSAFYSQYLPYAQSVSQRTGLDPRLVLAQAALESGWGKSAPNGNFFGIKSHGRPNGQTLVTSEYENGQYVPQEASFRTYAGPEQSFYDYGSFILDNPRYQPVMDAGDLQGQIAAMGASGYATDPEYSRKLSRIVGMFGGDGGNMQQPQQQQGLLGAAPQGNRRGDLAGAMAVAFNELRQRPSAAVPAMVEANRTRRAGNRTAEWLRGQPDGEAYAQMIENDGNAAQVLAAYQKASAGPSYRQMTGAELGMEGENATKLFNVGADGKVTGIGGSGTTVNVGGANSPYQEALDKQAAEIMLKWQTGGSADMSSQRENIALVLGQLEAGQPLTGPMQGAIQALGLGALFDPEATDAKQTVEQVVQRSLRETLGAQFTEKEGERLIQRAYNVSLPPEANARRLAALLNVLDQTISARQSMSDYLRENQTLLGYQGPTLPSTDEGMVSIIDNAMNSAAAAPEASTDPAGLTVGEVQDGYRYIGGPPNLQSSWEKVE